MTSPHFTAYQHIYRQDKKNKIKFWFFTLLGICALVFFLPWTQNIRAKGTVTTLRQEHRPQQINTIIGGRVDKWYVKEGDYVQKGDTILLLSEIKEDYLDPNLLMRTGQQIEAKQSSVNYYQSKITATESQIGALQNSLKAKINQLQNKLLQTRMKITSDSMDMVAAENDLKIATLQFNRQKALHDSGLVSLTQLEGRNQSYQTSLAKKTSSENKFLASKQEMSILQIEFSAVQQEYAEKVSKAEGEKFGSLSQVATGQGDISKLQNQYASYAIRNGMYHVIAPQSGQIIKARTSGIGEIVKEGAMLVHIVPDQMDYAVELYVRPVDLPLISAGQQVRFLFDGFPAIVFSGWPDASYGTYAGIVSAVENDVSDNGKFKVLIKEDASYRKWPKELKMGTGANGIALLKNVPIWYELWRNINSFPPDYYKPTETKEKSESYNLYISYVLLTAVQRAEKIFTEEEFIAVIKKYHPVAKQAALDVRIADAEVTSSRGYFDPVLSMDNARKEWDGINYYNQRQTEIKIPTWYGIDLYAGKENITGSRINPEETKGSLSYLGFSLPLLQNLILDKRRAALKQAKIFRDLSEVQRRIFVNDLLIEAIKAYWDWWEQFHINQLMQSSLQNAEKRFAMVKTAYRLGDRPAIDTLEAFTQIQSFAIKQNETFTSLIKANLQLSTFLWTENQLQYDLPADVVPQEWSMNDAIALDGLLKAASLNPELTQYQFKLNAQEIEKRLKFQLLLPQVNLKYNQIGYNFSKTVNAAWFQNNYRFGVSFYMPLRLSEGRGEYQKAKLKIEQTRLEQVNKQVQVYNKVKAYYTDWQQTTVQLSMQNSLVANITALQRGEETRFFNGESSLFLINSRELKTIETMQKLIELKSKNRKALVSLKWAAGLFSN